MVLASTARAHLALAALLGALACRAGAGPAPAAAAGPPPAGPSPAAAAPALIPADRLTRWAPGIPGGIPAVAAVHARVDAASLGNGRDDAAPAINRAIQAAGDAAARARTRQVVQLSAGSFRLGSAVMLNRSDVVLRGAGAERTTLVVDNPFTGVHLGRLQDYGPAIDVVASTEKGGSTFQVRSADADAIQVGDVLEIDQEDPPATLLPSGRMWMNGPIWLGDGRFNKRQPRTDFNGPGTGGKDFVYPAPSHLDPALGTWDNAANYNARFTGPWRSAGQQIEVKAKQVQGDRTSFTISGVFHLAFEASRRPQVWHTGTRWTEKRPMPGTQYAGIEALRVVGGPGAGSADSGAITGRNVAYCWVAGVEVSGDPSGGRPAIKGPLVALYHAFRCVVRDSYVHHSRILRPNSSSYGLYASNHSSDNLWENNIALWLCKPVMFNSSGGGNVVAYNYVDNAVISGNGWSENGIDLCHSSFCHGDLAEGNWSPNIGSDSTHGNAGWETIFRNFASGRNSTDDPRPDRNLRAIGADAWSGPHTVVGNVLHAFDAGRGVAYEATGRDHAGALVKGLVYRLGDNGSGGSGDQWDDGTAAAGLYRHGNWDSVGGVQRWDPANPVRALPDSLYLKGKPAFFGELPWPWIDPGGATPGERVKTLPAKARFDAGKPNG